MPESRETIFRPASGGGLRLVIAVSKLDTFVQVPITKRSESIGQQRHRRIEVAPDQHGAGERGRSETVANPVDRQVEVASAVQRQRKLDGSLVG